MTALDGSTHWVGCGRPNGPHDHDEPEHPDTRPEQHDHAYYCRKVGHPMIDGTDGLLADEECTCHLATNPEADSPPAEDELTAQRFATAYADRSGVTVEWLKEHGRDVRPCACGEPECQGWQMAHVREDETVDSPPADSPARCAQTVQGIRPDESRTTTEKCGGSPEQHAPENTQDSLRYRHPFVSPPADSPLLTTLRECLRHADKCPAANWKLKRECDCGVAAAIAQAEAVEALPAKWETARDSDGYAYPERNRYAAELRQILGMPE